MTAAWEIRGPEEIRVVCPLHGMDKTVDTPQYAANLVNYHNRESHPGGNWLKVTANDILNDPPIVPEQAWDISAASRVVMEAVDAVGWGRADPRYESGLRAVWEALTGLTGDEAIDVARKFAESEKTAFVPPF